MSSSENLDEAVDILQDLGLKEYEARCFVGLTRLPTATAKQLSDVTDVPRTRIYDAIRALESNGLVEVQHTSPKQFRAVSLSEATETLRDQYDDRIDRLRDRLQSLGSAEADEDEPIQEVWSMSGRTAIENRTDDLVADAEREVVLVVGDESLLTEELVAALHGVAADVDVIVGAVTDFLQRRIQDAVPNATTFTSGLEWLRGSDTEDDVAIGRLLLVDRSQFLVSSIDPATGEERAIFGCGVSNGLVVIARRLLAQGLVSRIDPGADVS
jgi:sugar-specific transcriptional regulator TrmB